MFGRIPVPYRAVLAASEVDKARAYEEADHQPLDDAERDRQQRSRYYGRLAVLPTQSGPPARASSRPISGSAVPIPSASSSSAASHSASRFARSSTSSAGSSHSLPCELRRSAPIDIPMTGRRAAGAAAGAAAALWYRRAWQGAADDTDGSGSSSGDSDAADEWCGGAGGERRFSDSLVDDSHLQWSGRCLDDQQWQPNVPQRGVAPWHKAAQLGAGSGEDDSDDEEGVEAGSVLPFPLLPPSYHVDFELN